MSATEKSSADERYRVRSVERALDALDVLGEADANGLRLSEIARSLDTSKSTALAVLRTLAARGFVAELGEGRGRRYRLGLTLARLGDQVLEQIDLLDVALPSLRAMTEETGWTSRLGVLDEDYAVMIGRVDGPGIIRFQSNLARLELPHCSAIGKALLSHLPEESVRTIVARTGLPPRTATTITRRRAAAASSSGACGSASSRSTTRRTARASSASERRSSTTGRCVLRRSASPGSS